MPSITLGRYFAGYLSSVNTRQIFWGDLASVPLGKYQIGCYRALCYTRQIPFTVTAPSSTAVEATCPLFLLSTKFCRVYFRTLPSTFYLPSVFINFAVCILFAECIMIVLPSTQNLPSLCVCAPRQRPYLPSSELYTLGK